MGPYKVDKLAVPQTPLPQQAGTAQAIFKFIVRCITYRGTNSLLLKTTTLSSSTTPCWELWHSFIVGILVHWAGAVVSTHVALVRQRRKRTGILQQHRPQLSKSLSVKGQLAIQSPGQGNEDPAFYDVPYMQDSTLTCSVAVLSTDTAGRGEHPRPSKGGPVLWVAIS